MNRMTPEVGFEEAYQWVHDNAQNITDVCLKRNKRWADFVTRFKNSDSEIGAAYKTDPDAFDENLREVSETQGCTALIENIPDKTGLPRGFYVVSGLVAFDMEGKLKANGHYYLMSRASGVNEYDIPQSELEADMRRKMGQGYDFESERTEGDERDDDRLFCLFAGQFIYGKSGRGQRIAELQRRAQEAKRPQLLRRVNQELTVVMGLRSEIDQVLRLSYGGVQKAMRAFRL